jgi:hypothetical protein
MKANTRRTQPANQPPRRQPTSAKKARSKFFPPRSTQPPKPPRKSKPPHQPKPPRQPQPPLKQRIQKAFTRALAHLLPLAGLLTVGALIISGGILSAKFILEPKSIVWINDYLPEGLQVPVPEWDRPQTLADIQKNLTRNDRQVGEIIELNNRDRLVPILQNGYNCISKCAHIAELRIYRPAKGNGPKRDQPHFRLIAQLAVGPVPDWTIATSLAQSENGSSDTSGEPLPLETYESLDSPEASTGTWFNLTGKRQQSEYSLTYGQLFHYDPKNSQLTALTQWSSPNPDHPIAWKQLTGSPTPELLIDHSIGLEPHFQAYQVSLKGTPSLTPIALTPSGSKDPDAPSALNLAKVGLWSIAADRLKQIKSSGGNWGTTAQAQLDLIQYHAKLTQDQAKQTWANSHQNVLVKLMDGQWQAALNLLEKDPLLPADLRESFTTETARLWKRLSVAIEDDPTNPSLQAWTAMVMLDRDGLTKTQTWLAKQGSSSTRNRALAMLAPSLIPPKPKPTPKAEEKSGEKTEDKSGEKPIDAPSNSQTSTPSADPKSTPKASPPTYPIAY